MFTGQSLFPRGNFSWSKATTFFLSRFHAKGFPSLSIMAMDIGGEEEICEKSEKPFLFNNWMNARTLNEKNVDSGEFEIKIEFVRWKKNFLLKNFSLLLISVTVVPSFLLLPGKWIGKLNDWLTKSSSKNFFSFSLIKNFAPYKNFTPLSISLTFGLLRGIDVYKRTVKTHFFPLEEI